MGYNVDNNIESTFHKVLNIQLQEIIISNPNNKELIQKIKIRPLLLKEQLCFQISEFRGQKVFHNNYKMEEVLEQLPKWFDGDNIENELEPPTVLKFKQVEIKSNKEQITILISKKGKATIKEKKVTTNLKESEILENSLLHNKKKKYILPEGKSVPFLVDLGVMTADGKILNSKYDKFKQINRFLEFVEDILPNLAKDRELTIIDFGCGKSYLTFALYYYLKELNQYNIRVIGLDLKEDVIAHCNDLSKQYGYEKLQFIKGDIASYEGVNQVDMVVTLHACDTATDYALEKAVRWDASVILSVPCCQHELNKQMKCKNLEAVTKYGLIKERTAALFTDALRANILESVGYKTQILEFIDMEHTPKNILIRAVKGGKNQKESKKEFEACKEFLGVEPTLAKLLEDRLI